MNTRELLVLFAMAAVWGFHFVVIKLAVAELPPIFYAAIRMTLVAALLSPLLRWRTGQMRNVLIAACCMGVLNYALMFNGVKLATASASAIAMQLYTPFATILAVLFLGDKLGWRRYSGIALAFAGVAIIALGKPEEADISGAQIALGVGFVATGAFIEATGAIFVKRSTGFNPLELLAWFSLVGTVGLWLLTALFETGQGAALAVSDKGFVISAVLYSAIASSIFGHTAFYWLLQRLPVSVAAISAPLTAIFAVAAGVIFLSDPFGPRMIIGAGLTIAGVAVVILRNAQKPAIKAAAIEPGATP